MHSDAEIILQPFKFTNDYDGFHLLVQKLDYPDSDSIITGLESTFPKLQYCCLEYHVFYCSHIIALKPQINLNKSDFLLLRFS